MKKVYFTPEEEIIVFSDEMAFTTDDSCGQCYYLVCTGEDVIIGKVKQPSDSKNSSEGPKNKVGFDMTFDR